jgi:hypothetical protein
MAKIGFLGCSYSAYNQKNVQENSWTYQLAEKFPQHQYYSYALGGRGVDYLQWCLLDAKEQDLDVIFVNTTYPSRVSYLVDSEWASNDFTFEDTKITENFKLREFSSSHIWSSHGTIGNQEIYKPLGKHFQGAINFQCTSENRNTYIKKFYKNIKNLYNFKHIILLNFVSPDGHDDTTSVISQMWDHFKVDNQTQAYRAGLVLALDDDHWTFKGNQWVLNNFILNKETIDILNHI